MCHQLEGQNPFLQGCFWSSPVPIMRQYVRDAQGSLEWLVSTRLFPSYGKGYLNLRPGWNHFSVRWRIKECNGISTILPYHSGCIRASSISWRSALSTENFSVRANFPLSLEKISFVHVPLQAPAQDVGTLKDRKAFCSLNMQVCAMSRVSSSFSGSFHIAHAVQFCWMSAVWNFPHWLSCGK